VVNLGVQGFGTDQSLLQAKRHLPAFNTKAVVYTFICPHALRNTVPERRLLYPRSRFLGTKPLFALAEDGTLSLERTPVKYQGLEYSRLAAVLRLFWTKYGPVPEMKLTRALVSEMREVVERAGARFVLVNWDVPGLSKNCGPSPFEGMELVTVNTLDYGSDDGSSWIVPGDGHPDARAHGRVARLILEKFREKGILPP
jgi:hypothetical protein